MALNLFKYNTFKSVHERPTKYFAILVALLFALFLQAYMHNFNIVYITLFTLFSVAYVAHFFGRKNIMHISLELRSFGRYFCKREGEVSLILNNISTSNAYALGLKSELFTTEVVALKATSKTLLKVDITPQNRGKTVIESVELYSFFPFNLQRFYKRFSFNHVITVLAEPKGESILEFFMRQEEFVNYKSELKQLRNYQLGDSMSVVHWPLVAREVWLSKEFHEKVFEHEIRLSYEEILGNHECKLSQLTKWLLECEQFGIAATVILPNCTYSFQGEDATLILEAIACL